MRKVGDKFIVEIDKVLVPDYGLSAIEADASELLYRIKGFKSLVFDEHGLRKLEKPLFGGEADYKKALDEVSIDSYKEGYDAGFDAGVKAGNLAATGESYAQGLKDGYEKGRKDVWDWCGEYIVAEEDGGVIPVCDLRRIFTVDFFGDIFKSFSPAEAKQIVDEYLEKQFPNRPAVGDEVRYKGDPPSKPFVVTRVSVESDGYFVDGIYDNGSILEDGKYALMEKTGRHFPIEDLLKQMEGGNE